MYLIDPGLNWYKANLHTHSTLSDGKQTPRELKEVYAALGYQILCITDHELCVDHSYMSDEKFLMLTGYEMGGINSEKWNRRAKTYHLCYISRDPHNTRQVYRIKNFSDEARALMKDADADYPWRWTYSTESINEMIALGKEQNYLVTYNHPGWSLQSYPDYAGLKGLWGVEVWNSTCCVDGYDDNNQKVYQDLLMLGNHLCPVAADDLHNAANRRKIKGFCMIGADSLEYGSVIQAMEKGNVYASTGPRILSVRYEDGMVYVECDAAQHINLNTQFRFSKQVRAKTGETITEAVFDLKLWLEDCTEEEAADDSPFFRITVVGPDGSTAFTRPFRRSDIL